ncbi:MAG TPA: YgjP-like metallopeptidase domain-containing protein [Ktedonobacteraceae bacterium]
MEKTFHGNQEKRTLQFTLEKLRRTPWRHGLRVAAPLHINDEAVRLFTISRLAWIKRQQAKFASQERQSARELVSGESHYYRGNRYVLNVIYRKGTPAVIICNNKTMNLYVRPASDTPERERVLTTWYRIAFRSLMTTF